ncbi:CCA tRNA nucleotidyltransferase, partial [bacterium]|nr:CCA tRNA nucleotidyltransferase [bacterium]
MELAGAFSDAGFDLLLVGGSVRDALLGRIGVVQDLDFATSARPDDTLGILRSIADDVYTVGKEFGTIGAIVGGTLRTSATFDHETQDTY